MGMENLARDISALSFPLPIVTKAAASPAMA